MSRTHRVAIPIPAGTAQGEASVIENDLIVPADKAWGYDIEVTLAGQKAKPVARRRKPAPEAANAAQSEARWRASDVRPSDALAAWRARLSPTTHGTAGSDGAWQGRETPFSVTATDDPLFDRRLVLPPEVTGGWIVLRYALPVRARPQRPLLRLRRSGGRIDRFVLPGPVLGTAHWLGYLPADCAAIEIAVGRASRWSESARGVRRMSSPNASGNIPSRPRGPSCSGARR